ncbi:MAG: cell division protein FtsL [SAR324 cluster bacterium]
MIEHASPSRVPRFRTGASAVLVVLCAAVVAAGGLFYVWQRYQFTKLGFEVAQLRQRKAHLEEQLEPSQVEVDYLARLERIDTLAREQLGMRPPAPGQTIVVEPHAAAP